MARNLFRMRHYLLAVLLALGSTMAAQDVRLESPDKHIQLEIDLSGEISYRLLHDSEIVLENGRIQLVLEQESLGKNPRLKKQTRRLVEREIRPVVPLKYALVEDRYNHLLLEFRDGYSLEFRMYNDGMAYRFNTKKKGEVKVVDEVFAVGFPGNYRAHMQQPSGFKTAYEEPYTIVETNTWQQSDKMAVLPLLIDTKKACKLLISEADLSDYPCMFLKGNGQNGMGSVFPHVPLEVGEDGDRSQKILKEADYIAKTSGTRSFPWRYIVVAKEDKVLLENTMTLKLSSLNQLADVSWIKPGQVSWEWWNDASPYGSDVNFVSGYNLETYKYYIDFAAQFGIPYIIMDEGWAKSTRDPYTPNPKVDVHELIRYGKEKNVGIVLWLTWLTVENHFDLFKTFKDWGVKGVKIDFMDRSDQWMVNYYERVAQEAARHELFVDFHGSFKPAGLEYKYPNVLSYEGVRGMEQMGGCYPDNSIYYPFIRNAVGPMDYTPGAMISMQPEVYCGHRPNSASIGTRAYQMALFVIFESGLQMLADNPTLYYRNKDCTEFITQVPTTWDNTHVLAAKLGEYVVVAKQKGDEWFIGAMCNNKERWKELEFSLDFLPDDTSYEMTSFSDGINAPRQAMDYRKSVSSVRKTDKLDIRLSRNGGYAARLKKLNTRH